MINPEALNRLIKIEEENKLLRQERDMLLDTCRAAKEELKYCGYSMTVGLELLLNKAIRACDGEKEGV